MSFVDVDQLAREFESVSFQYMQQQNLFFRRHFGRVIFAGLPGTLAFVPFGLRIFILLSRR